MDFLESALEYVGIVGQLLLFYFLLRGPFRRYYLVFIYALVEMLGTFAGKYAVNRWGRPSRQYHDVYFGTEVFGDLLLLVVLILFTYQLMEDSPIRGKVRRVLAVVGLGAGFLPFVLFGSGWFSGTWYNSAIQVYNFGGAIMMLALWTAVIARKTRDRQLLLVCSGLGIALAGNAALWGMRKFTSTSDARAVTSVLIQLMYLLRLGIWSWAFRPARRDGAPPLAAKPSVG